MAGFTPVGQPAKLPSWVGKPAWGFRLNTDTSGNPVNGDAQQGCSTNDYYLGVHGDNVLIGGFVAGTLTGSIGGYAKASGSL